MKSIEVVAALMVDNARVYVTQRGHGEFRGMWEFPGGKVESGETLYQALARELKEELDIDVNVGEEYAHIRHDYPTFHLSMHLMRTYLVSGEPKLLEHTSAMWAKDDELLSLKFLPADKVIVEQIAREIKNGVL